MDDKATTIDMIRHGEPQGGTRFRGYLDHPLSELGWQQMQDAVAGYHGWDLVCSSPLKRCSEFAKKLSYERNIPLQIVEQFKEVSFGDWQGKTYEEVEQVTPGAVDRFFADPVENQIPNSEDFDVFNARVHEAFTKLIADNDGKRVLLVGHGAVIRSALNLMLDLPMNNIFRIEVQFASITTIRVERSEAGLKYFLVAHGS
ncbi:MAG: histidine phosphatase family protein [Gammaproteobacteria bacterium]|nr:MAG: histidine phosphatase family protein [Gammaproteobacteria bacterium]